MRTMTAVQPRKGNFRKLPMTYLVAYEPDRARAGIRQACADAYPPTWPGAAAALGCGRRTIIRWAAQLGVTDECLRILSAGKAIVADKVDEEGDEDEEGDVQPWR